MASASTVPSLSCDLVARSKQHVAFLGSLHQLGVTLQPVTAHMVHRYATMWLPLVVADGISSSSSSQERLRIPPPDIAWMWHCHRLAPGRYQAFCETRFGRIVEPNPPFGFQEEYSQQSIADQERECELTRKVWDRMFPGEPFFLTRNDANHHCTKTGDHVATTSPCVSCETTRGMLDLLDGFDMVASSQCQASFLWQVSGPRFADDAFLEQAVINYHRFLQLKNAALPLVPTYQIDLMWHTHMLVNTAEYNQDCIRVHGSTFHHDDSLNDRTKGAKLDLAFQSTIRLWKEAYDNQEYVVPGGMYRGEPADVYYNTVLWTPELGYDAGDALLGMNRVALVVAGSSSSGTNSVHCWEFAGKDLDWKAYADEHQELIEQAFQKLEAASKVEIKSGKWTYKVNVTTMKQTNVEQGGHKEQEIRRRVDANDKDPATVKAATCEIVAWEFYSDSGWECYSLGNTSLLENAYFHCLTLKTVAIETADASYSVDVANMTQTNVDHQLNVRRRMVTPGKVATAENNADKLYSASSVPTKVPTRPWRDPIRDRSCFLQADPKSTVRNINNNVQKDGFVFGCGTAGDGYYSLETRDAYTILHQRLKRREAYAKQDVDKFDCSKCLCFGFKPTLAQMRRKEELIRKYEELSSMAAFVEAKYRAEGPDVTRDVNGVKRHTDTNDVYKNTVWAAAGCGGGDKGCGAGCGYVQMEVGSL